MKSTPRALIALLMLGFAGGCQTVKVDTDYDETVDFSSYQTFGWMPQPREATRNPQINDIMDNRIKRAIEGEYTMAARLAIKKTAQRHFPLVSLLLDL